MILKEQRLLEVETNDENVDENSEELEIGKSETNKLFNILLESYKNPRASFIREICSNAWDAHKVINSEEPVVIRLGCDDGGEYIEFIDKGIGMTANFIKRTFKYLLKSTKNSSNIEIGGFGIKKITFCIVY